MCCLFTYVAKKYLLLIYSTTITAIGCWQCLPFSVVQLKGKHCRNGVVDTFGQYLKRSNDRNLQRPKPFFLQIGLSVSIGPVLLYFTLDCWVYPLRDYIGETGCHTMILFKNTGSFILQLQSFFTSTFRYICVFHNGSILYLNLSPHVSSFVVLIVFSVSSLKNTIVHILYRHSS